MASSVTYSMSNETYIDSLLTGVTYKWGTDPVSNTTVLTYSFPGNFQNDVSYWNSNLYSLDNEYQNMQYVNEQTAQAFRSALQAWANVANIEFVEILDTQVNAGDIRLAYYNNMDASSGAWGYYPGDYSAAGDIWLNPDYISNADSFENGSYEYQTLLHELGHALGLSHPFDDATNANYDHRTTIMSYNYHPTAIFYDGSPIGRWVYPETPMINDIAAMQYLYGVNTTFHAADDVYTFDTGTPFIKTIWDSGGNDTIYLANFLKGCLVNLLEGSLSSITVLSDPGPGYTLAGVPNVYNGIDNLGIAFGTIIENATGGYGNDKLYGNNSANLLLGKGGNDILNGRGGADTMLGGSGNDTYYVDVLDKVYETNTTSSASGNAGGTDKVISAGSYTLGSYIENLTLIGTAAINATGNSLNNILIGNSGSNILNGGSGSDTMYGGAGNDTYYVNVSTDKVYETSSANGTDLVVTTVSYSLGSYVENVRINTSAAVNATGNTLKNTIYAGSGNNTLDGGSGTDTLSYAYTTSTTTAGVTVSLATTSAQTTGRSGIDIIKNFENLTGSKYNDKLTGNAGNNIINGGKGNDTLTGGSGNDIFVFSTAFNASTNKDTITDFSSLYDTIKLENAIFTALIATGTLNSAYFKANTIGQAIDTNDYIVYETDTGKLFYDQDGSGAGDAVQIALLANKPSITYNDFVIM